ncbi:glycosyltransferase family 2 protein [Vulcanisaeta sp. JCM 14467]|uniref:glycosyltransferase family 2 protein n=1 Tax=Vulcanisaeta sp. JCM 14467 TaxID=1295370 RepID=UPI002093A817|nr:glycosyltransferase family 2 protein [Vulcanisaeta sp. JCM 14467]
MIVYKPSPGDRTLDVVDEFRDKLDIEVKIQNEGFFEEAMNMIFEASRDYDITLTTDDDAIPTTSWIQEHTNMHKQHEKIGIFRGMINNVFIDERHLHIILHITMHIIGYYKPLLPELRNYVIFINDSGLLAYNSGLIKAIAKSNATMYYNVARGVNMSFKSRFIDDFKLPGATIRGLHNEQLLLLHYLNNHKFHTAWFKGGDVVHIDRESISRSKNLKSRFMIDVETMLLPYMITQYGVKINLNKLKRYHELIKIYSRFRKTIVIRAYESGLRLAIEAIENNYEPREVRNKLIELNKEVNIII